MTPQPDRVAQVVAWLPIDSAPKDGSYLHVRYADGSEECDVYWADQRYCMLGIPQGSRGPGWVSTGAGNLPVDEVTHWAIAIEAGEPFKETPR